MKKFINTLLSAALISIFSVSTYSAMPTVTQPTPVVSENIFDGFYVGIGAGVASLVNDISQELIRAEQQKFEIFDSGGHDFTAHAFGGFGKTFSPIYLGAEIFFRYVPSEAKTSLSLTNKTIDNFTAYIDTYNSYGGIIKIGYLPNQNTMTYILVGADETKFTIKTFLLNLLSRKNKQTIAFMLGAGIETYLYKNITIRTQYSYSDYSKFNHQWKISIDDRTTNINEKISPKRSIWTVDLIYHI